MAVSQSTPGVGLFNVGREITTEFGVTLFQLSAGVFGGIAALVASQRLESAPEHIPLGTLAPAVAVAGLSTIAGAFLLPTGA